MNDDILLEELIADGCFMDMLEAGEDYMFALGWAVSANAVAEAAEDAEFDPQAWVL